METNYLSGGTRYQNLLTMMETTDMMSPSIIALLGLAGASVGYRAGFYTGPACVQTGTQLLVAHVVQSVSRHTLWGHGREWQGPIPLTTDLLPNNN